MTTDIVSALIEHPKLPPLLTSRQIDEGSPVMPTPQYGDYQFDIYFDGLEGQLPKYPVDFAIYCSNHGGRQANGGLPALDALPAVVEAADGMPVLFDSGVRSGSDVAKAVALGRPPWGSAARTRTPWPSAAPTASWPNCAPSSPNWTC
jgi:FMN-dependent dehydrogenase